MGNVPLQPDDSASMQLVPEFGPAGLAGAVRILVVEDDALYAALVAAELEAVPSVKVRVEHAETLERALALIDQGPFDLLLTDLSLPDSMHLETVERLAAHTDRLIVAMTAHKDDGLRDMAVAQGAYDLVEKDRLDRRELERLVRLAVLQPDPARQRKDGATCSQEPSEELQRLRESEERYRGLLELSSDWYWVQDADYRFVRMSGRVQPHVRDARIGKACWEIPTDEPVHGTWAEHRAKVERHEPYRDLLLRCRRPDGTTGYVSVNGQPIFKDGAFAGYEGSTKDVTDRVRTEEVLQRFRTALDHSADMILIIDPAAMRYVDANETACRLLGYSREEILALGPHDVLPDTRENIEKSYAALIAGSRDDGVLNSYYLCKDGSQLPFESTRHKVRSGERWLIAAISRDIRERDATQAALRESEERFRALTALSSDVFWEQDAEFRFVAITGTGTERHPSHFKAMLGKRRWELPFFNMSEAAWEAHRAALRGGLSFRDLELGRFRDDGQAYWTSVSGAPILDERGRLKGYRGVGKDITARKREERLLALEHSAAGLLAKARDVEEALRAVMGAVCRSEQWQCARYFEVDAGGSCMRLRCSWTDGSEAMDGFVGRSAGLEYGAGHGLVGRVWESGEALWVEDASVDPRVAMKGLAKLAGLHGALIVPVRFEGRTMGVLSISSAKVLAPDERLLRTLQVVGDQVGQFVQRKLAEAAVARSEARFRQAFELAASGIAHVSLEGRLLRVNRRLCEVLGYEEGELLGLTVSELSHPNDAQVSVNGLQEMRAGARASIHFEKRYRRKSGAYAWFSVNVATVRGEGGLPLYEVAVFDDITERRAQDDALRESEARFRSLTELSSDFYWETDAEHRITKIIHGSLHSSISGGIAVYGGKRRWEMPSLYPDAQGWAAHRAWLDAHLPFREFEFARIDPGGAERHVSISGEPVLDAAGAFVGYRGIGKEITARKREERLLKLEHGVALALADAQTLSGGIEAVIRLVAEADGWWGGRYWEEDADAGVLRLREAWARPASPAERHNALLRDATYRPGEGLSGQVWQAGEPLWATDADRDPRTLRKMQSYGVDQRTCFVFPVIAGRRTMGVLAFDTGEPRRPNERLLQAARVIGPQLGQFVERQRAHQAVRESEERFRNLSELSSDWFWEQDEALRFTRLFGNTYANLSQAMIGKTRWEAPGVDPDSPEMREHRERLERRERFRDFEYAYRGEDGRRIHVRVSGYPFFDAQGRFKGYRGMARNVTRQRERRDQLRRFRTALDASADIILLVDPRDELRLLDFNETACYYLGYTREELIGQPSDRLVSGLAADQLQASLEQLIARKDRTDLVLRTYRRKDGSTFEAEVLRRVVESAEGPIVVVNARDLTERRRAEERQAAHLRYQEATARFGRAALDKRDAGALIEEAVELVREALGEGVALYIERGAGEADVLLRGAAGIAQPADAVVPLSGADRLRRVLADGEPFLLDGGHGAVLPALPGGEACTSGAFVPVHAGHEVRGVLAALSPVPGALGPEESKFLVAAASVLSGGLSRIESEQRLAFLAQFDVLTGLPNRALLRDRFAQLIVQARRRGSLLGVLFIDLDDFKLVNDSLGHAGGDELLKAVAGRLQGAVRAGDTVARISGDEFAVILGDLARPDDGALVAQKILDLLAPPLAIAGQEVFVTASIGIAAFPADGDDAEALLAAADAAMYRAKQTGRSNYHFFTPDINQRTRARAQLGSELRHALERDEFEVFYQPKFDLRSGRPCAAEALLRWQHPERGLVSPAEFVPVLEETGLIVPVGESVLRRACEDLKRWAGAGLPPPPVAVNLSARQFRQQNLDVRILEIVRSAGVDPRLLELEITESQLMHDPEHAARVLRSLDEAGIRVAIDDFGTGYSSLSYLTRFPVSALKIDRSFVADVLEDQADAAIVRAIIDMAHTLGFIVVAEGVETGAQAVLLRSLGCEQAQGYHFARPLPEPEFRALLARFAAP